MVDNPLEAWRVQALHDLELSLNQTYTVCFRARAESARSIEVNFDGAADSDYAAYMTGGVFSPSLSTSYQSYSHTFIASATDATSRLAIGVGNLAIDVWLDDVGVYLGSECGNP